MSSKPLVLEVPDIAGFTVCLFPLIGIYMKYIYGIVYVTYIKCVVVIYRRTSCVQPI
jgi:hypothetical protein